MVRWALPLLLVLAVISPLAGQAAEFEVASIKRNTSGDLPFGPTPDPATGQILLRQVPARTLILQAYPVQTLPIQILNLPPWADERYDVVAKGKPSPSADERQQMFRALLADRMKLAAHYETREQDSYDLVFARADQRLGSGIKPSSLTCSHGTPNGPVPPAASAADARAAALKRCGAFWVEGDTIMSGGVTIDILTRMITSATGRPIINRTGLDGYFDITLRFQRFPPRATTEPNPDAAPLVFTALPEQLGLRLESSKTQGQILVIDHIERPTEN
jgi:uncharacterized protein (TIGR03435 family)